MFLAAAMASCQLLDDPSRGVEEAGKQRAAAAAGDSKIFEGSYYSEFDFLIADYFEKHGLDSTTDVGRLHPSWPLRTTDSMVMNRMGTPTQFINYDAPAASLHVGFDFLRPTNQSSDEVLAPFSGYAMHFDTRANPATPDFDYVSVVAVWDEASHVISVMRHVSPSTQVGASNGLVRVTQGDVVGHLAMQLDFLPDESRESLRHIHLNLVDTTQKKLLNPASYFGYQDTVQPTIESLYVLDANNVKQDKLCSDKLNLAFETYDRDDRSNRNFEIESIAYRIVDSAGECIREMPRCRLMHLIEDSISLSTYHPLAIRLLDFTSAAAVLGRGGWPDADYADPLREFRYILTRLQVVNGRCTLQEGNEGALEIEQSRAPITVEISVWDHNNNSTTDSRQLSY